MSCGCNKILSFSTAPGQYTGARIYDFDLPYIHRVSMIRGDFKADRPTVNLPRFAVYSANRPYNQFAPVVYNRYMY